MTSCEDFTCYATAHIVAKFEMLIENIFYTVLLAFFNCGKKIKPVASS